MIESFRSLFAPPRDLILVVAALWIGLTLSEKRSERHGLPKDALNNLTFYSLLGYIIGGRIFYALSNFSAFEDSPLNLFSINIDLFDPASGIFTAIVVGYAYGRRQSLPFWGALDALAPFFATLAIGLHLSHLAAGTAFGSPTDLPWGINLWNATRHPTQIYELLGSLLIFAWIWFRKADSPPGALFLNFAALTAGARLLLETFRADGPVIAGGFRLAQITAWLVLAVALIVSEYVSGDLRKTAAPRQ